MPNATNLVYGEAKSRSKKFDANEVAGFGWFKLEAIEERMREHPEELVPSANALWPEIFQGSKI